MEESILISVKKVLGIDERYHHFDEDVIMHINTVFVILNQLGIGPDSPFFIRDESGHWCDFLNDATHLELVKTYMYLRVRMLFDPPSSSAVMEAMNRNKDEIEWRMTIIKGESE